jgi:hypothetical protein
VARVEVSSPINLLHAHVSIGLKLLLASFAIQVAKRGEGVPLLNTI